MLLSPNSESTACYAMLNELQTLWDEIGESAVERDKVILQLEQECFNIYQRKVNHTRKQKSDLGQTLTEMKAEISRLILSLGEQQETFLKMEKLKGTLKDQVAVIVPMVEDLKSRRDERLKNFLDIQSKIFKIQAELSGIPVENFTAQLFDEEDLSQRRVGELNAQFNELRKEKNRRLEEVDRFIESIQDISNVLSVCFTQVIKKVHPCFVDKRSDLSKSISEDTLARLARSKQSLLDEKRERLLKIQAIGGKLIELWKLMDTPLEEQKNFEFTTCLLSLSIEEVVEKGCLSMDVIDQAEEELEKLNTLKSIKMKEIILKRQLELEAIYDEAHIDKEEAKKAICDVIETGNVDPSEMLSGINDRIEKARELALGRKEILDKVEKWIFASQEELWLDDYERDRNRYTAIRGAHKNLKRAEKARKLVAKLPLTVDLLVEKIKVWEKEKACLFLYDKERLLDILEKYSVQRNQKEEEKRRTREQRKLQEQLATEQEMLYGSKRSPLVPSSGKKPLGQSSQMNMNMNMNMNTVAGSCHIMPQSHHGGGAPAAIKEKMRGNIKPAAIPINFVALAKDNSLSPNPFIPPSP